MVLGLLRREPPVPLLCSTIEDRPPVWISAPLADLRVTIERLLHELLLLIQAGTTPGPPRAGRRIALDSPPIPRPPPPLSKLRNWDEEGGFSSLRPPAGLHLRPGVLPGPKALFPTGPRATFSRRRAKGFPPEDVAEAQAPPERRSPTRGDVPPFSTSPTFRDP